MQFPLCFTVLIVETLPRSAPFPIHPSYPYGNPTNIKHPASRPHVPYDPTSRALFEDMGYAGGGINGMLRWKDLALDMLLPVDKEKEDAKKAAHAGKWPAAPPQTSIRPLHSNWRPEAKKGMPMTRMKMTKRRR